MPYGSQGVKGFGDDDYDDDDYETIIKVDTEEK